MLTARRGLDVDVIVVHGLPLGPPAQGQREGQIWPRSTDTLGVGLNANTTGLIYPTVGFIGALALDSHLDLVNVLPFASICAVDIGEYPYPRELE